MKAQDLFLCRRVARLIVASAFICLSGIAQTGYEIKGTIADESGAAIAAANVTAEDPAGHISPAVTTGSDGSFAIAGVTPGRYVIRVEKEQFQTALMDFELAATGQAEPLRITLRVGGLSESLTVTESAISLPRSKR